MNKTKYSISVYYIKMHIRTSWLVNVTQKLIITVKSKFHYTQFTIINFI